ncbi:heavy-metal-associated domain-containing protein [Flavobacteriales bacterium]|nr:heavy-metal-associated domain-containing protein [Flavobacteriales bacterium]
MNTYKFNIQNLKCGGCVSTITKKISEIDNVFHVKVNEEESSITFEAENNGPELVKNKLSLLGYPLEDELNSTLSKAKSYVSCMVGKMTK